MNIVKETLNFERDINPKDAMTIGDVKGRKLKDALISTPGKGNQKIYFDDSYANGNKSPIF